MQMMVIIASHARCFLLITARSLFSSFHRMCHMLAVGSKHAQR
jgi:hypothetical protein